jgi:hypothetical protein
MDIVTYRIVMCLIKTWLGFVTGFICLTKIHKRNYNHLKISPSPQQAWTNLQLYLNSSGTNQIWIQAVLLLGVFCVFPILFVSLELVDLIFRFSLELFNLSRTSLFFNFSYLGCCVYTAKETPASALPVLFSISVTAGNKFVSREVSVRYSGQVLQQAGYERNTVLVAARTLPQTHEFRNVTIFKWSSLFLFSTAAWSRRYNEPLHHARMKTSESLLYWNFHYDRKQGQTSTYPFQQMKSVRLVFLK